MIANYRIIEGNTDFSPTFHLDKAYTTFIVRVFWTHIAGLPLKISEKILLNMAYFELNGTKLKYPDNTRPRCSLLRSVLTGKYFSEAYFILSDPVWTVTCFRNLVNRFWRFYKYEPVV